MTRSLRNTITILTLLLVVQSVSGQVRLKIKTPKIKKPAFLDKKKEKAEEEEKASSDADLTSQGGEVKLNQGLLAHLPFSQKANDVTGNGYDLRAIVKGKDQNGGLKEALTLGGLKYAFSKEMSFQKGFAMSVWLQPKRLKDQGQPAIISDMQESTFAINIDCWKRPKAIRVLIPKAGVNESIPAGDIENDKWHHLAVNVGSGQVSVYLNGKLLKMVKGPANLDLSDLMLVLGNNNKGQRILYGSIDELRVYNRVLNSNEVQLLSQFQQEAPKNMESKEVAVSSPTRGYVASIYKDSITNKKYPYVKIGNYYWITQKAQVYGEEKMSWGSAKLWGCPRGWFIPSVEVFNSLNQHMKENAWTKEDLKIWGASYGGEEKQWWTSDEYKYDDSQGIMADMSLKLGKPTIRTINNVDKDAEYFCRCVTKIDPKKLPAVLAAYDAKKKQEGEQKAQAKQVAEAKAKAVEESRRNVEVDTLVDQRDGNRYKILKIGEQWWMAENLRYKPEDYLNKEMTFDRNTNASWFAKDTRSGFLYKYDEENYQPHGVLYKKFITPPYRVNICPDGWQIPTDEDWLKLERFMGVNTALDPKTFATYPKPNPTRPQATKRLQEAGFGLKESGRWTANKGFNKLGFTGFFWTQSFDPKNQQMIIREFSGGTLKRTHMGESSKAFSCRCVRED